MQKITYYCDRCGREITNDLNVITVRDVSELCTCCLDDLYINVKGWLEMDRIEKVEHPRNKDKRRRTCLKLDLPKIGALRTAGWSLKKISEEFGCSTQTIANHLDEALRLYRDGLESGMIRKEVDVDDQEGS